VQRRDDPHDPGSSPNGNAALATQLSDPEARTRAIAATMLGRARHRWPSGLADQLSSLLEHDEDAVVRSAALGALVRRAHPSRAARAWERGTDDDDGAVRLAAARLATHPRLVDAPAVVDTVLALSRDSDELVAEQACFALGELVGVHDADAATVVGALAAHARDHADALVREAAVAALGSIGHPDGRAAVLHACTDKPAVRRRAVLALSVFDGPDVEAALTRALEDRDWQVRQAAEDVAGV
jgi:HEAT repeat protein